MVEIDPTELEIAELGPKIKDVDDPDELRAMLALEEEGEDRVPVKTLIESYQGDIWVEDRAPSDFEGGRSGTDDGADRTTPRDGHETVDDGREGAVFVVELPKVELN